MLGCDVRSASPQASLMIHNYNSHFAGFKTAARLTADARLLARLDDEMAQIIGHLSRYPHWQLRADLEAEKIPHCDRRLDARNSHGAAAITDPRLIGTYSWTEK